MNGQPAVPVVKATIEYRERSTVSLCSNLLGTGPLTHNYSLRNVGYPDMHRTRICTTNYLAVWGSFHALVLLVIEVIVAFLEIELVQIA
jgi:hypothetical protein